MFGNAMSRLMGKQSPGKNKDVAKSRLQLMLSTNIRHQNEPDYMPALKKDIMEVLAKYIKVDPELLNVEVEREDDAQTLKVDLVIPEQD